MNSVPMKRGNLDTETDAYKGRTPREDEGRNQDDASTGQGMSKIAGKPPEAKRKAHNRFSLKALRSNQPSQHLDLRFSASRTVRQ